MDISEMNDTTRARLYSNLHKALLDDTKGITELAKTLALVRIADALESIDNKLYSVIFTDSAGCHYIQTSTY